MAVGDLAEVVLQYDESTNNNRYINVFGFKAQTVGASLSGLATAFKIALVKNTTGGLFNVMSTALSSQSLVVRDVYPGTAAPYVYNYTAVAGVETTDRLPPQAAGVLSWRTTLAGRSYRGRTYLPGGTEFQQAAGRWVTAQITNYQSIIDNMLAVFGPAGSDTNWRFCVISKVSGGAPRVPPIGTIIDNGHPDAIVYTQRRRTIGVGG